MEKTIIFLILSIPIIALSWHTLFNVKSHGFYRFFGWEGILWLVISNYKFWFVNPFSLQQMFSWVFLFFGAYLVFVGFLEMQKKGRAEKSRKAESLYHFEKTTELVDTGIFKYIRHPLYSSLIFLTWGILFKQVTIPLIIVAVVSTVFLYFTSITDEKECVAYFGDKYSEYMKRTKRFIPFII
jgi:protein-S-isoprenylcysteine O-methyltransferase Ste14